MASAKNAPASATKKRRSSAAAATATVDGGSDPVKKNGKKRKVVATTAAAPLTAVAARRLAAEQALQKQQEDDRKASKANNRSVAGVAVEDRVGNASQISDAAEDSDQDDEDDDDESEEPIASTSKQPYSDLMMPEGPPKRYFLGGAASMDSSAAASPVTVEEENDIEASFVASEGEYIQTGDVSRAESVTYTKRPSRRRRRAENAANFYLDPLCASTWRPSSDNSTRRSSQDGTNELIVGMYPGETILLRGCCSLKVLRGSISIDCAEVDSSSDALPILAPSTHALPTIRALRATSSAQENITQDSSIELEQPIILSLQSITTGVESIEGICRLAGMPIPTSGMWHLPSRWSSASDEEKDTYKILFEPERDLCASVIPHNWIDALEAFQSGTKTGEIGGKASYIVQGPKGVGKSTFSKLLANTLLTRHRTVAYLDCDLGQPEFTPSGCLSLSLVTQPILGPSFTHLHKRPARMHYLGSATPKDDPAFYIWAISDLLEHYTNLVDEAGVAIPLVINTQGWYKGLGADLLLGIHRLVQPSTCFDFASGTYPANEFGAFDGSASAAIVDPSAETTVVPMQPYAMPENAPPRLNASDLRILQFVSYFHINPTARLTSSSTPSWDFSASLVTKPPYAVLFSAFQSIKVSVSETIDFSDLFKALDVSIVALREEDITPEVEESDSGKATLRSAHNRGYQQHSSRALGLGIIRSIDNSSQNFHILTPLPPSVLERVNAITKGDIELPTVLMVDYTGGEGADENGLLGVEWKRVPYLEHGENINAGVGHGRRRVRRNVMRRSQFK